MLNTGARLTFALLLAASGGALAATPLGPSPYLSSADSPFLGTSFNYFYLENFEDGLFNVPGVTASTGGIGYNNIYVDSVDADDGVIDGSGRAGHSLAIGAYAVELSFAFDAQVLGRLPTHAGLVWTDSHPGYDTVTFTAYDANGVSLGPISAYLGDGTTLGGTAEDRFFGIINPGGISRISMSSANNMTWEVDHLQFGAAPVPEPTSAALLGIGLASLAGWRRRQAKRDHGLAMTDEVRLAQGG